MFPAESLTGRMNTIHHGFQSRRILPGDTALSRLIVPVMLPVVTLFLTGSATAQVTLTETPSLEKDYALDIRILTLPSASARVRAQDWSRVFDELNISVTIASDNGREKTGIHLVSSRTSETLKAVGIMDRTGNLQFENRKFRLTDDRTIANYFNDLKKHGPGGPVRTRSTWGLSDDQFKQLLGQLAAPCGQSIQATSAVDVANALELQLPDEFLITWSEAAQHLANAVHKKPRTLRFDRLSTGTALAVGLAQFGLGFRPLAHPDGGILLEADAGSEGSNLWPTGWKNTGPMNQAAPKAFKAIAVDLEDVEVDSLIATIAEKIDVPYYYAQQALEAAGVDVESATYSRKPGRLSPLRLLKLVGSRNRMSLELRTDEAGSIFLWCTTPQEHADWKKRFGHFRPQ